MAFPKYTQSTAVAHTQSTLLDTSYWDNNSLAANSKVIDLRGKLQRDRYALTILLVDDDEDILRLIKRQLEYNFLHLTVLTAKTWDQAMEITDHQKLDMMILDISLAEGDALVILTEKYRGNPPWPVIVMSSHREVHYAFRAIKSGAVHFLDKSMESFSLLIEIIQSPHEYCDDFNKERPCSTTDHNGRLRLVKR